MKTKRALEITIETHETTTIRLGQSQVVSAFCEICGMQTMHLPLADAVADLRSSETAILRLVETGLTHSHENVSGLRLICSNRSGFRRKDKEKSGGTEPEISKK